MIREILCPDCARRYNLHPLDSARGLQMRKVEIAKVRVPDRHGVTINGEFRPMEAIHCDHCDSIVSGAAVACTTWDKRRQGEPGNWEGEYAS